MGADLNSNFRPVLKPGRWELTQLQMKESVAIEEGSALYSDLAGEMTVMTGTETNFVGILAEPIASTDSDYATAKKLKYAWIPKTNNAEVEFAVGAGTFTNADVGKTVALNDGVGVAVDTAGTVFRITKYLTSTRGVGVFNTGFSQT